MTKFSRAFTLLTGLALIPLMQGNVSAAEVIDVPIDQSRMMTLSATPGAVIVGNPSIADVSLHADKVFLHGRAFGHTNLIILDLQGEPIVQFDLTVSNNAPSAMALYEGTLVGARRKSYNCWPLCESAMQTGDDADYNIVITTANAAKSALATGKTSSEAKAPAAPQ